jgi:iron-sulfur cluster repair protein YtfE (RIC family)
MDTEIFTINQAIDTTFTSNEIDVPIISVISELRNTHKELLNKYIPEIEQHFLQLLRIGLKNELLVTTACFTKFHDMRTKLTDHIEMEESIVFPAILIGSVRENRAIYEFLQHHEDHEVKLKELIMDIGNVLSNLNHLMVYRQLILKMRSFHDRLSQHGEIEDLLFRKVMN